ncbi:MAG: hypothetical protein JWQ81_5693 [Amycolatopsis sp.]|jgi:hypothetical protein|uniref:hypothetical protein n=1 Tax=Amycolatopsis sp. TaxID=37632 RepID=UPI00261691CA|nr:hypothetical protein [Amycolatopsis sp.]MCU1684954.1 hypothetical protein [Amycolatopsis sp.]
MKRGLSLVAAGVGVALLLAGCGDKVAGTASPAPGAAGAPVSSAGAPSSSGSSGSTSSAEGWMDQFCGAFVPLVSLSTAVPTMSGTDVASTKKALINYLTKAVGAFQNAVDTLNSLPPAPTPDGDTAKKALVTAFTPALQTMKDANAKLASSSNDPQALLDAVKAMEGLGTSMDSMSAPMNSLTTSPELEAAYKAAPNCKKLPA